EPAPVVEEPAPVVEEPAPAADDEGFVTAPPFVSDFGAGSPAPGVPPVQGFEMAAAPVVEEAPAPAVEPAPAPVVEEAPAEEPAPAVEEPAPAAEGFTQAAPANDGFTQAGAAVGGFTQAAPANDGFQQTQGQWTTGAQEGPVPYNVPQGDYMKTAEPPKKGGKKKFLIPLFIIIGLLVVGGIGWAVMGGGSKTADTSTADPATYKENCILVPYDDLFDDLEKYTGENVEFTGQIFEIHEEDGMKVFVMDTVHDTTNDTYYGGTLIVRCNPDKEGMPAVENWDVITVYGPVEEGLDTFSSEFGEYSVPVIDAEYIDINE
ncbi:MAG: hypothetical protein IIY73_06630, partial [Solobacterium sp.]|nr:hypothetical protein [Solobacterium sp.]